MDGDIIAVIVYASFLFVLFCILAWVVVKKDFDRKKWFRHNLKFISKTYQRIPVLTKREYQVFSATYY